MGKLGVRVAAATVISLSASASAFAPATPLPRSRHTPLSASHRAPASRRLALRAIAPGRTEDAVGEEQQLPERKSFVPPRVVNSPWRVQSPYRNNDGASTSYLNQFPNTWQPAERIADEKSRDRRGEGDTVSTSGVRLQTADTTKTYDAAVVGTGPAGLAIAMNLAKNGMSVAVLGPIAGAWPNNYGVWLDEWAALGLPDYCLEHTYKSTRITISATESIGIDRSYGKVRGITCRLGFRV
jgi:hypothetical protein